MARYLFDLHMHSRHSFDGVMAPAHMIRLARRRGLAGIAVTDHNTIVGGLEAAALNDRDDFLVVVGAEIQTEVGDILGLFLTDEIRSRTGADVVAEIHDQGGVAVLPHPYSHHRNLTSPLLACLDAVEIYNGRDRRDYSDAARADFAVPYDLATVANSDAHLHWEIGRACTSLELDRLDPESLRQALLRQECRPVRRATRRSVAAVYTSKVVKRLKRFL